MTSSYHRQEVAPGGCSHALLLHLNYHSPAPSKTQVHRQQRGKLVSQLVTARDDVIRIYDIYRTSAQSSTASHRIILAREHCLFGTITGLGRIQTLASDQDGRDRLLVSFNDAKLALLEWSDAQNDLETISIHTYERAPQLFNGVPHLFQPSLQVDPLSRCAALLLPQDALAILPFYRDAAELDFDAEMPATEAIDSWPYSPSFILTMREVDPKIENLRDFCFLPGFQKPTMAVLFAQPPTWTGLVGERKDNFSVYLFTLDLSASIDGLASSAPTYDDGVFRSAHPVVTTSSALPIDCLYMVPCPQTLGGVMVVSMSSLIHIDQSGRVVITAITDWFKTISALDVESTISLDGTTDLQGSQLAFTGDTTGVFTLADGQIYLFRCMLDGRSMEGVRFERMEEATEDTQNYVPATGPPTSSLQTLPGSTDYIFSASLAGSSRLYEVVATTRNNDPDHADEAVSNGAAADLDMDLDDDLYGSSNGPAAGPNGTNGIKTQKTISTLSRAADVRSHGGFTSMARRKLRTRGSTSKHGLVAAHGSGHQAGLIYLDPRLSLTSLQKISNEQNEDTPAPEQDFSRAFVVGENDDQLQVICSANEAESSVAFLYASESQRIKQTTQLSHTTLCASPILGNKIGRVTPTSLQILSADLEVLHEVPVGTGSHFVDAHIDAKEFAILHTSDGETIVYKLDDKQSSFELLSLSTALGDAQVVCLNAFRDVHSQLDFLDSAKTEATTLPAEDEEEVDYGDDGNDIRQSSSQSPHSGKAYLFVLDSSDVCRILSLPDLTPVWQNHSLAAQPQRLSQEETRQGNLSPEQVANIDTAVACHIGDVLSIVSLSQDNFLSVFELVVEQSSISFSRTFVDVLVQPASTRSFDVNGDGVKNRSLLVRLQPLLLPGANTVADNALAILGAGRETAASLLFKPEQGAVRVVDWPEGDAVSICSTATASAASDVVFCDQKGAVWSARLPASLQDGVQWTSYSYSTGREYTKVVAHDPTYSIIAASVSPCPFVLYDEDGEAVKDASLDPTPAFSQRGALELFVDEDKQTPVDGFEFEANEIVTALEVVSLDATSEPSGRKMFVAAGTTTYHGEDRTSKGSVYLFEVVEVVSSRYQIGPDLRLKLICRDETKAPVTAIADINGFLINTSGQKLFVRTLEKEEWLIPLAFQDCPFYITSIRVVKNLILLSDIKRSLWFLAFQEEPYRFVSLGKDMNEQNVSLGNFLVNHDKLSLVATSGEALGGISGTSRQAGVIRLLEYAPNVTTSLGGQRLLVRSEYQTPSEAVASSMCRGRWLSDSELRGREETRNKLLFAKANGAIESLASVDDKVAKRLNLLQGQLVRSVQHFAGLNPRGFRTVKNEFVARPLAKGVLDGRLLTHFLYLSRPKMLEAVRSLQGVFDGLDKAPNADLKRKYGEDSETTLNEQDETENYAQMETRRRKSEQKRVQLLIKDLLRLRTGFEPV